VYFHLANNAIKFTKKVGRTEGSANTITIIVEDKNEDDNDDKSVVVVSVQDTGPGIDPEILPRLFSKFVTNSQTGTGLGLFISKSIVEAHGGKMWAHNNNDIFGQRTKGARFYFTLPIINKSTINQPTKTKTNTDAINKEEEGEREVIITIP